MFITNCFANLSVLFSQLRVLFVLSHGMNAEHDMMTVSLRKVLRSMFRDLLEVYKYEVTRVGNEKVGSGGNSDGFNPHTETLKQVTVLTIKALKHMHFDF